MSYVVSVDGINKSIGKTKIIDNTSFKLKKGKIYGLIGSNGAGKSTLLKIILGLYSTDGNVTINGYDIRLMYRDAIKDVGAIVDYVSFYDYLTAYENLRYFAMMYQVPFKRVEEVLKLVKLDKNDKKPVKNYSLGMKQRLGLGIALLKDPSILVLDEPMNGLDPKGIVELRELLLSFKDKTIIISSHIIAEIEKIVDNILFINNKKVMLRVVHKSENGANVKFKLSDYKKASLTFGVEEMNEESAFYMTNEEVSDYVKKLNKKKVDIYRIEEETLENELLSLMDGNNG